MPKSNRKWNVEWNAPITLPALTQRLHEAGAGRQDLVEILEDRNRELVDALCGPRYQHNAPGTHRRAGTRARSLGTRFGKIRVRVTRVRPKTGGPTLVPLWADVQIQARRVYQPDVDALVEQAATRLTYRNTREELGKTIPGAPGPHTINRRVMMDGAELASKIHRRDLEATAHQGDGTKLPTRDGKKQDVNIVLATRPDGKPRLRGLTVGQAWDAHASALAHTTCRNPQGEAVPVNALSDFERGLREALTPTGGAWQGDHVHVPRALTFALWQDGLGRGEAQKAFTRTAVGLLAHLRNSLNHHLPKGETEAVEHRIQQTIKEFRRLATRLWHEGYHKAANFLRRSAVAVTTYATLALKGILIPWHNNVLERLMGEVSKRCKHKWMSWTGPGAQALLTLLVVRTVEPDTHDEYWRRKLYGENAKYPDLGVRITRMEAEC